MGFRFFLSTRKSKKTVSIKAFPVKGKEMVTSQNRKLNEKHCGFCISQPCRSRVAAGILMKSCRETAFQARRQPASSPKIKKQVENTVGFYVLPTSAGPAMCGIMENAGDYCTSDNSPSGNLRQKKNRASNPWLWLGDSVPSRVDCKTLEKR